VPASRMAVSISMQRRSSRAHRERRLSRALSNPRAASR
jgi:hypothetical protein